MKSFGWAKFAIVGGILAALLFSIDRFVGLPAIVGYENTSLAEIISREKFARVAWKRAEKGDEPIRIKMVDDLLRNYSLVGMSRTQIDALLGVPPKTDYFSNYDYVYWLGPERGWMSIDSEWLCIKFKNDQVVEAKVLRD